MGKHPFYCMPMDRMGSQLIQVSGQPSWVFSTEDLFMELPIYAAEVKWDATGTKMANYWRRRILLLILMIVRNILLMRNIQALVIFLQWEEAQEDF